MITEMRVKSSKVEWVQEASGVGEGWTGGGVGLIGAEGGGEGSAEVAWTTTAVTWEVGSIAAGEASMEVTEGEASTTAADLTVAAEAAAAGLRVGVEVPATLAASTRPRTRRPRPASPRATWRRGRGTGSAPTRAAATTTSHGGQRSGRIKIT